MVQPCLAISDTCSTSCARSATLMRSVKVVLRIVVQHRDADLGQDRPTVHAGVDDEKGGTGDLDSVAKRVPRTVHARKGGQECVVRVDVSSAEPLQEPRSHQLEEAGRIDQIRPVTGGPLGQRSIPRVAVRVVADPLHEPGNSAAAACCRPPALCRSARDRNDSIRCSITAGEASNAARLDPPPEISTTTRSRPGWGRNRSRCGGSTSGAGGSVERSECTWSLSSLTVRARPRVEAPGVRDSPACRWPGSW